MAMATAACSRAVQVMALAMAAAVVMSTVPASGTTTTTLQYGFYGSSCPKAEETVRNVVEGMIMNDPTMGAAFVRLFFHDCFVRGCDASILLDPTRSNRQTEKTAIPLRGYDAVNKIKAAVEAVCPGVVSCSDILAFAARDSAVVSGNFAFAMPSGRRDGLVSSALDVIQGIPSPAFQLQDLIDSFAAKGLTAGDLVILSGAHSFGLTHCSFVTSRLYPTVDPTMNATFAAALKKVCPPPAKGGGGKAVSNNQVTDPNALSNQFFKNVATGQVMFTSDQTLTSRSDTAAMVADNAANPVAWMARFAAAMVKMGGIEVLTGNAGEVRKVCSATNTAS
ncbi:peroxidase 2-like [Oryza brachyantha]|uniref:Peroxidase n=1 Tax=Oryza brachyantha TaxID=4533 RepID=J3M3R1_ORYBR|nr:peroxidase 2-like [Oryza brachyantha]